MCTASANRECASSLRKGMSAGGLRPGTVHSSGSTLPVRDLAGETLSWQEMYDIFWGSQETCPRKHQDRQLNASEREKVLESGDLETCLGLPTITLEDSELITLLIQAPVSSSLKCTKSSISSVVASQLCHVFLSGTCQIGHRMINTNICSTVGRAYVLVGRAVYH